jgi:hypothetical protein
MNSELFGVIMLCVAGSILVMLALRHINCWYWKINKRIALQQESIDIQKQTLELLKKLLGEDNNPNNTDLNNPDIMEKLREKLKNQ